MPKSRVFGDYYTSGEIAQELGCTRQNVEYHVKTGTFPAPKLHITYVKMYGDIMRDHIIRLWDSRQLKRMQRAYNKLYDGLYKRFKHPVTGKYSRPPQNRRPLSRPVQPPVIVKQALLL